MELVADLGNIDENDLAHRLDIPLIDVEKITAIHPLPSMVYRRIRAHEKRNSTKPL
jgi:hypothetical protein